MFSHYHNYAAGPLWPAHSLSHFVHQHYMRNGCSVWGFKSNPAWMLCVIFRIPILGFTCLFFGRWQKSLKNDPFTLSNWIFHPFHDLHIFLNYNPKTILTVVFVIFFMELLSSGVNIYYNIWQFEERQYYDNYTAWSLLAHPPDCK